MSYWVIIIISMTVLTLKLENMIVILFTLNIFSSNSKLRNHNVSLENFRKSTMEKLNGEEGYIGSN